MTYQPAKSCEVCDLCGAKVHSRYLPKLGLDEGFEGWCGIDIIRHVRATADLTCRVEHTRIDLCPTCASVFDKFRATNA